MRDFRSKIWGLIDLYLIQKIMARGVGVLKKSIRPPSGGVNIIAYIFDTRTSMVVLYIVQEVPVPSYNTWVTNNLR